MRQAQHVTPVHQQYSRRVRSTVPSVAVATCHQNTRFLPTVSGRAAETYRLEKRTTADRLRLQWNATGYTTLPFIYF